MNAETFLKQFGHLADAPNGVQKLRELVLQLAMSGRLSAQEPTEVSTTDDRGSLDFEPSANGKRAALSSEVDTFLKLPFALPRNWGSVPLVAVCKLINGDRSKNYPSRAEFSENGIPFINAGHLRNGQVCLDDMNYIPPARFELLKSGKVQENDLLFCLRGSLGKCAIVRNIAQGAIASSLVIVRPSRFISADFVLRYFLSPLASTMVRRFDNGTAQPNLSAADLGKFSLPLPPLAEQHRIVAKVDELLALCDELETQQGRRTVVRTAFATASLARLTAAPTPAETAGAWSRVAQHFDTLFAVPQTIPQLRQTILQLAVTGRLVEQDEGEEPAEELLAKVANAESRARSASKPRRRENLGVSKDGQPYPLPASWRWTTLLTLISPDSTLSYGVLVPGPDTPDGIPFVRLQDLDVGNPSDRPNKSISPEYEAPYQRTRLRGGEILLGVVGSIGKLGVVPPCWIGANIARAVCRIVPSPAVDAAYLLLVLQSDTAQTYFQQSTRTLAQPTLNIAQVEKTPIPVPPRAEQARVVEKVRELAALLDTLEAQLTARQGTAERLTAAIVSNLVV